MGFRMAVGQHLEVDCGGCEQSLHLHLGPTPELRFIHAVLLFGVGVDALTNGASAFEEAPAAAAAKAVLHLLNDARVPASRDHAISGTGSALRLERTLSTGALGDFVHGLVAVVVLADAMQLLALWADVEVALSNVRELRAVKATMWVGGCPHSQQGLHLSGYASLHGDLTAVATVTDQLAWPAVQSQPMLVERSADRLPIRLPGRPHLYSGDHIRLAAVDQEVRLVPEHGWLARPHYLLCIRVGRADAEIIDSGAAGVGSLSTQLRATLAATAIGLQVVLVDHPELVQEPAGVRQLLSQQGSRT